MSDVTVAQFAEVLKVPVEKLLKQFEEAGIAVGGADATITDDQKGELLSFLRRSHGRTEEETASAGPRKITLKRKTQSEIKVNAAVVGHLQLFVHVKLYIQEQRVFNSQIFQNNN